MRKATKEQITRSDPKIKRRVGLSIGEVRMRELVAAGFDEGILKGFVDAIAHASNERKPAVAGIKNRQIRALAQRTCRLASEIMAANDKVSKGSGRPASEVPGAHLPVELGLYATWLLFLSKTPLEYRVSDRQLLKLLLIAATRKFTGKPHYAALSDLLSDASRQVVSVEALLQLASDHKLQIREMEGQMYNLIAPLLGGLSH